MPLALDKIDTAKVAAIASLDEEEGKKACEHFGAVYYKDYKELLAKEKELDGIIVRCQIICTTRDVWMLSNQVLRIYFVKSLFVLPQNSRESWLNLYRKRVSCSRRAI